MLHNSPSQWDTSQAPVLLMYTDGRPDSSCPANTTRSNNDVLMLGDRRRRRANIKTALFQRVVFAGMCQR